MPWLWGTSFGILDWRFLSFRGTLTTHCSCWSVTLGHLSGDPSITCGSELASTVSLPFLSEP